ncbi:hypothetical protein M422DRAFT_258148, partial [Sphaerobolus stellatus SS14]
MVEEFVYIPDPVFTFVRGQEMRLKDELARLDAAEEASVWIIATDGPDGDAARGLVRTLIKELPAWKIHLVIFDASWSPGRRHTAIAKLQDEASSVEPEIKVTAEGAVFVPRVVPQASAVIESAFDTSKTWMKVDANAVHTSLPPLGTFDVVVEISHWSSVDSDGPRAFMGTVSNKGATEFTMGEYVMGIIEGPVCNRLVAHAGSLVPCEKKHAAALADAVGLVIGALALGPGTLNRTGRLAAIQHALITDVHTTTGHAIARLFNQLGLDIFCIGEGDAAELAESLGIPVGRVSVASNALWVARQRCLYDVILSGAQSKPDVQLVTQLGMPQGILHFWNSDSQRLSDVLKRDPWIVAHALEVALQVLPADFVSHVKAVSIEDAAPVPSGTPVSDEGPLFDPRKTYLLIGGIGGMGVQMARWMYENGARDIVLTSRRGRETLRRTGQTASLRTLRYLERLPDLSLSLEAVDAGDHEATSNLVKSLEKPIGGVFL